MKVILIDDEKAMHLIMKRMLAKTSVEVEITGSFTETETAFSYLMNHDVDLVFLDISMPRKLG